MNNKEGFSRDVVPAPELNDKPENVPNPGAIERTPQSKPPMWVWVVILVVAILIVMALVYRTRAQTGAYAMFPIMGISMVAMLFARRGGDRKNRPAAVNDRRARYLRDLDELRGRLHERAGEQAREIAYHHPDPTNGSLLTLVGSPRMWERRPDARNFGHARMGMGVTRINTLLIPPDKVPPPEFQETVTAMAARDFLLAQNVVHDVARPLHLFDQMGWAFFADLEQRPTVQGLLRSLVCQICVFHGPDDVAVAIITDDAAAWDWAKWLPHTADKLFVDASGEARLIFGDVASFVDRFGPELAARNAWAPRLPGAKDPDDWLVVVVDYPGANCAEILGGSGYAGVSVLEATGDENSVLATRATAFQIDELGNLLKAEEGS